MPSVSTPIRPASSDCSSSRCSSSSPFGQQVAGSIARNSVTTQRPTQEKVEVKAVEGRKNFSDKAVITPLPAIMIAAWDENKNPNVMMAAWGGQCGLKHITFELSKHKTTDNIRLKKAFTITPRPNVDAPIIDEEGNIDLGKLQPVIFISCQIRVKRIRFAFPRASPKIEKSRDAGHKKSR